MLEAVADGKFDGIEKLITRRISLEDFVEKGINALIHERDEQGGSIRYVHMVQRAVLTKILDGSLQ